MSQIPFDVLLKTRDSGAGLARPKRRAQEREEKRKASARPAKRPAAGSDSEEESSGEEEAGAGAKAGKKKGKHMPKEISSRRPYNPFKASARAQAKRKRDPRFDKGAAAQLDDRAAARARKNYGFVFDEIMAEEEQGLRASLKKAKGEASRTELQGQLKHLQRQVSHHKQEKRKLETKSRLRRTGKPSAVGAGVGKSAKTGKRFFMKRSEVKKQLLLDKYNELKKSGKLEDYLAKKRRRNASKEHKNIPLNRRQ